MNTIPRLQRPNFIKSLYYTLPCLCWFFIGGLMVSMEEKRSIFIWINTHSNDFGDAIMPYITNLGEGYFIIPSLLLLLLFRKNRNLYFFAALVACNILPMLITQGIKAWVNAPRPLAYFPDTSWIHHLASQPYNYYKSFPSGHTEGIFAFTTFLALILPPKWKWLGIPLFIMALAVGYSRMYLAHHFFADVYVGSLIGMLFCLLTYAAISKLEQRSAIL
jgi:membrane-associated phospholipid phosphatase